MRPPRTARSSRGSRRSRSTAPAAPGTGGAVAAGWSRALPAVTRPGGGTRPSRARAVSVLPEPDSPTSPTTSPRPTSKAAPRTTGDHPFPAGKAISRSRTSRRGEGAAVIGGRPALPGEPAEPAHQGGDAEAGGARAGRALGLDVGDAGDVEVGPALDLAHELRQERRGGAGAPPAAGGVAEV